MMRNTDFKRWFAGVLLAGLASMAGLFADDNRIQDASFEEGLRPWFEGKGDYFLGLEKVPDARDGNRVLVVEGWNEKGSFILSPVMTFSGNPWSATISVRCVGTHEAGDVSVELALFDESGAEKRVSFGSEKLAGDSGWTEIIASGVEIPEGIEKGRLGICIAGPQRGLRLEFDQAGLFPGEEVKPVKNNAQVFAGEASKLANGTGWKAVSREGDSMYADRAIGEQVLSGCDPEPEGEGLEVVQQVPIQHEGNYHFWVRFLHTRKLPLAGNFTMELRQGGEVIASKEIACDDDKYGRPWMWVWDSVSGNLSPGNAELVLRRPPQECSWVSRRIDYLCLTNLTDYRPEMHDFLPQGYVRFRNRSEHLEPFCLWFNIRRHMGPNWYSVPGILSHAGFSGGYVVPPDRTKWLEPGDVTPWVRITDHLLDAGGRNNVEVIATRQDHRQGYVSGRIQGDLEFAVGEDRQIVKTIAVDQEAPRILFTLPLNFQKAAHEIRNGFDYLSEGEAVLPPAKSMENPRTSYLQITGILELRKGLDDPALLTREIQMMKRLGMNNTFFPCAPYPEAKAFQEDMGLLPLFGFKHQASLVAVGKGPQGVQELEDFAEKKARELEPVIDSLCRIMIADEPRAMRYDQIADSEMMKQRFREWLPKQGVSLEELGLASWEEANPVLPEDKHKHPELFYYTGLFRLHAFAEDVKTAQAVFRKFFPPQARAAVNLTPAVFNGVADEEGHDEYLLYRNGGLDMMWTEDWLGYGASVQQLSTYLAMMRVAGRPDQRWLGGYLIPHEDPAVQRIKTYLWLADGVRMLDLYCYGPYYAAVDSWSTKYSIFPTLAALGEEMRTLDPLLEGNVRRPAEIAILYNRTAGIWRDFAAATEADARYIHWALAHAGYDADLIPEEDVEAGDLASYKLLYVNGVQVRRPTAEAIKSWVANGGMVVGTAGALTRDVFNRPLDVLDEVFGGRSEDLKLVDDAGRPAYETRALPALGVVRTRSGSPLPQVEFDRLALTEKISPAEGAEVVLERGSSPAGLLHSFGKGRALRLGVLPGLAYLREAIRGENYDLKTRLPQDYRKELRDFIAAPAKWAGVQPVAIWNDATAASVTRWSGPDREILYVIDFLGKEHPDFCLTIPDAGSFAKARTLQGQPVSLKTVGNGALEVRFPLKVADAVILER